MVVYLISCYCKLPLLTYKANLYCNQTSNQIRTLLCIFKATNVSYVLTNAQSGKIANKV